MPALGRFMRVTLNHMHVLPATSLARHEVEERLAVLWADLPNDIKHLDAESMRAGAARTLPKYTPLLSTTFLLGFPQGLGPLGSARLATKLGLPF